MADIDRIKQLAAEAAARIRELEADARDHEQLGEKVAIRIEDLGCVAQDIEEALDG